MEVLSPTSMYVYMDNAWLVLSEYVILFLIKAFHIAVLFQQANNTNEKDYTQLQLQSKQALKIL